MSLNKWGWAILVKGGVLTAVFLTYSFHPDIKKLDYNIFSRNAPVAESFYQNPPILDIKWEENDKGEIETYLVNNSSGKKTKVLYDMLPSNKTIVDAMQKRFEDGYSEDESIDEVVDESFDVFQAATNAKFSEQYSDSSMSVNDISLVVEQDKNGENNLYLTNGVAKVRINQELFEEDIALNFGKYEGMLGDNGKKKAAKMFTQFLDQKYEQFERNSQ